MLSDWLDDHPGHPLGHGMPTGSTLRADGESHAEAFASIVRRDPCSYCGGPGGTLDHIVPKDPLVSNPHGGKHGWLNFAGACESCNGRKGSGRLLQFMAVRAGCRNATLKPEAHRASEMVLEGAVG